MKLKTIFVSMFAAMSAMFVFSACSSNSDDPDSYYQWYVLDADKSIITTSQSTGLFAEWINKKIREVEGSYAGDGTFASDAEPIAKAEQLSEALQQAVNDFKAACHEMDFGEGECDIPYMAALNKEGNVIKAYPMATFTYSEPSRIIMDKVFTPADLKDNKLIITVDDLKLEEGVTIQGSAPTRIYNDADNTRLNETELVKDLELGEKSITLTFQDLSGKSGKLRILQPAFLKLADVTKETAICIYMDLK